MVKQQMARVNVDVLGISERKWTGMGEFNSDNHYIHYCGQESLRRNRVALIVNKRVRNAVAGCNLKNDRMISVHFQGKPFNITVIQCILITWKLWTFLSVFLFVQSHCDSLCDRLRLILMPKRHILSSGGMLENSTNESQIHKGICTVTPSFHCP